MSDIGIRTSKSVVNENQSWIHGSSVANGDIRGAVTITLKTSLFSRATFPNGLIPSGVVLGKETASGLYGPYDDAATSGLEVARYHLLTTVEWDPASTTPNLPAAGIDEVRVIEANLPTGHGLDAAAKADLKNVKYV